MKKVDVAQTLDIKGLSCPMPLLWAKTQLDSLRPGEVLEVLATDPSAESNFQAFCRASGHKIIEATEKDGVLSLLIAK